MKIVCGACEMRAAEVVCCAGEEDEEAIGFCGDCDFKFHATPSNLPLIPVHRRLLLSSSTLPKCDACRESMGFFFCLEDRMMLCRECDISKHLTSPKAAHQRIFLPGVKVGREAIDFAKKIDHKPIDLPESSSHSLMPEFEGDANGLYDWSSAIRSVDSLMNEDIVEDDISGMAHEFVNQTV